MKLKFITRKLCIGEGSARRQVTPKGTLHVKKCWTDILVRSGRTTRCSPVDTVDMVLASKEMQVVATDDPKLLNF